MGKTKRKTEHSPTPTFKKVKNLRSMESKTILSDLDLSDSEEDAGRLEAQDFLAEAVTKHRSITKTGSHSSKFQAIVEQKKLSLIQALNKITEETYTQRTTSQASLASLGAVILSTAITIASDTVGIPPTSAPSLASNSFLHRKSRSIILSSKEAIRKYDRVTRTIFAEEESLQLAQNWNGDNQKVLDLLDIGKRATGEEVRQLMNLEDSEITQATTPNVSNSINDTSLWADFHVAREKYNGGDSWALIARRTGKDIQRLVKHVQER